MERNWDPEIKKFFVKILNSVALGLFWMMACAIAGIYYEFGYTNGKPLIYTIIFYAGMVISLFFLIRYLYKTWKNGWLDNFLLSRSSNKNIRRHAEQLK